MSDSLREQLLKAGLVSSQQARNAERQRDRAQHAHGKLPKAQRAQPSEQELVRQQAQREKSARDQELNRRTQEKAERKARHAQLKQLIEQHRLARPQTEESINYVDGNKIRKIRADAALREAIQRGAIKIVRFEGRYELVQAEIGERIRAIEPRALIDYQTSTASATDEADYAQYAVPDDLVW